MTKCLGMHFHPGKKLSKKGPFDCLYSNWA